MQGRSVWCQISVGGSIGDSRCGERGPGESSLLSNVRKELGELLKREAHHGTEPPIAR